MQNIYKMMEKLIKDLFPLNRSITGKDTYKTLKYIKNILPDLRIKSVQSGTRVYDWKIPQEWNVSDAYVKDICGNKIIDFKKNNLHLVGYSTSINKWVNKKDLFKRLHSLKEQPNSIPYVTSYFKKYWGFCVEYNKKKFFKDKKYHAVIKSSHKNGKMNYADFLVKGKSKKEILFSTYICHPSMLNDNLSGIAVTTALAKYLKNKKNLNFSYRFIFTPETIGTVAYINQNLKKLKKNTLAGYVITCVGNNKSFSLMPSRSNNTLADRVTRHVLEKNKINYINYSFEKRGSQERQFCSPLVDLPVVTITRSRFGSFSEYHTSKDNLKLLNRKGLLGAFKFFIKCSEEFENQRLFISKNFCEPMMNKYNLYPSISKKKVSSSGKTNYQFLPTDIRLMRDIIAYSDGKTFLYEIASTLNKSYKTCLNLAQKLRKIGLIKQIN